MIQFAPIKLSPEYAKEWNEHMTDFFHLCDEQGDKINDTLYRKGGIGGSFKDGYCVLIKHVEAEYPDNITTDPKGKKHLESRFCVINEKGEEKMIAEHFGSITHHGGLLFSVRGLSTSSKLYNVETGEYFGEIHDALSSNDFVFFQFSDWGVKTRGIKKVNKFTGEVEFFPLTR